MPPKLATAVRKYTLRYWTISRQMVDGPEGFIMAIDP
jgi:hypothetical protein